MGKDVMCGTKQGWRDAVPTPPCLASGYETAAWKAEGWTRSSWFHVLQGARVGRGQVKAQWMRRWCPGKTRPQHEAGWRG